MELKDFLTILVLEFKKQNIKYCVLRNYNTLPYTLESGDIDILVDKKEIKKISNILNNIKDTFIIGTTKRNYVHNFFIYNIDKGSTSQALQVDFIFNYVYKGINYINTDLILNNSIKYNNDVVDFNIPKPFHEALIEFMPQYLSMGIINKKYQDNIINTMKKSKKDFFENFDNIDKNIVSDIYQSIVENNTKKLKESVKEFRNKILKKFFNIKHMLFHYFIELVLRVPFNNCRMIYIELNPKDINELTSELESFSKELIFINIKNILEFNKLFYSNKNYSIYIIYLPVMYNVNILNYINKILGR